MYVIRSPDSAGAFSNQSDFTGKWPQVSLMAHSIFVWLPIISAGTGFLSSAGARVVRESSKIVSLLPLLAAIIIIINIIFIIIIIIIMSSLRDLSTSKCCFQGHEASSKEASAKEVEARLNAMKQHNELQQELLQHVLQYHDSFSSIENLAAVAAGTDSELSGTELRDRLMGSLVWRWFRMF